MAFIIVSATSYFLIAGTLVCLFLILVDYLRVKKRSKKECDDGVSLLPEPPGPKPWPILGSLHILGQYDVPYKAFADLARVYDSQVVKLKMGSVPCIVVNGLENIKEVLITKGHHFDSRPNFSRYHQLFCGNKENSLAFCDWSEVQKSRREMLWVHAFPRTFTHRYRHLNSIISQQMVLLMSRLDHTYDKQFQTKSLILHSCANIFTRYFCSRSFGYEHAAFRRMVENFDLVFFEVNQGYAADFLPFLMPLHRRNMAKMAHWSHKIREFVNENIIEERYSGWSKSVLETDYVDCLVNYVKMDRKPRLSWDAALFALEDIIGGHSAVGNLMVKVLGFLVSEPAVQKKAQLEIDSVSTATDIVGLENRGHMPYTEAIILEAIRLIASPIVPHVASRDSSIAGYRVKKNTFIFLNNYDLNMSEKLWDAPKEFKPERFVQEDRLTKPEHFLPFGGGRRSCMGYKMVQNISFSMLATILKNFTICPIEQESYKVPIGNLALPKDTFNFRFERR
ncbi:cytochrome P450 307a1-like [Orussus abietinus]|uniref:cytochrome P450 307a1-like n=1 Tax=Orussus abietinus TaxID=222816 RepID=UPI000626315F|nr:cytochrome P450 307a1-like [Orussus abietinus]